LIDFALPVAFTLFLWWFSTGVVLYLNRLPRETYPRSIAGATAVLAASFAALALTRDTASPAGAYVAFTAALLAWGWLEMTYFMGFLTGPREEPCPRDANAWQRFGRGVQASLYHELAVVGFAGLIALLTWDSANRTGLLAFVVLWVMRWSAKLNLFLGVPNRHEEFLPDHLRFLSTFMARRRMNLLFPVSVVASTAAVVLLAQAALAPGAPPHEVAGLMLGTTLLALAVLEHWFLVLPLGDTALWRWAMNSQPDVAPESLPTMLRRT